MSYWLILPLRKSKETGIRCSENLYLVIDLFLTEWKEQNFQQFKMSPGNSVCIFRHFLLLNCLLFNSGGMAMFFVSLLRREGAFHHRFE